MYDSRKISLVQTNLEELLFLQFLSLVSVLFQISRLPSTEVFQDFWFFSPT